MDKKFKVRWIVGISLFVLSLIALYTLEGIPFKILYTLFCAVASIELISFFRHKKEMLNIVLAILETLFLIGSVLFVSRTNISAFWYIILGVWGYDIFAYLFGSIFGGKVFTGAKPFPRISKNKTWEGTILGLLMSFALCLITIEIRGTIATDWIYLLCGPLALIGDLFESFLKRKFNIKDSNEIAIKNKMLAKIEFLVGGSTGHGGFLDRIDSTAFATTILLIIILVG